MTHATIAELTTPAMRGVCRRVLVCRALRKTAAPACGGNTVKTCVGVGRCTELRNRGGALLAIAVLHAKICATSVKSAVGMTGVVTTTAGAACVPRVVDYRNIDMGASPKGVPACVACSFQTIMRVRRRAIAAVRARTAAHTADAAIVGRLITVGCVPTVPRVRAEIVMTRVAARRTWRPMRRLVEAFCRHG